MTWLIENMLVNIFTGYCDKICISLNLFQMSTKTLRISPDYEKKNPLSLITSHYISLHQTSLKSTKYNLYYQLLAKLYITFHYVVTF